MSSGGAQVCSCSLRLNDRGALVSGLLNIPLWLVTVVFVHLGNALVGHCCLILAVLCTEILLAFLACRETSHLLYFAIEALL